MYSTKRNIQQLAVLLREHDISQIVLCTGSRNIPLTQTLARVADYKCYPMTDERSAGFYALGLALHGGHPVAVVCDGGSALLNLHPAVAEAYYQQIPLVVISADRPAQWIGQMDGQTLPQGEVFKTLVKKSVSLPDVHTEEEAWHSNRLINEALMELTHHGKGPVHINVPVSEPLFDMSATELPQERVIRRYEGLNMYNNDYQPLIERLNRYRNRMVIAGQMSLIYLFDKKYVKQLGKQFVWITESIGNKTVPGTPIRHIDQVLYPMDKSTMANMRPELLITYGGHIISRRLKYFLRNNPPLEHWHVSKDGEVCDLYQGALTTVIEMDPFEFLEKIAPLIEDVPSTYPRQWEQIASGIRTPQLPFSEMTAVGELLSHLPTPSALHLANSSTTQYAQLYDVADEVEVLCNRGMSGTEGSLSTALGYATMDEKLNFVVIGDLSFFQDMNALWNRNYGSNIRILLLNNGGSELVHTLPKVELDEASERFLTAKHDASAKAWAEDRGFKYLAATNSEELEAGIKELTQPSITRQPILLEVFTDRAEDAKLLKEYYHSLKK
jgi:2-succinyl-5-enolpyruvyl-6-hydroxy-3-cyclohexene-1-carboxylate synthase